MDDKPPFKREVLTVIIWALVVVVIFVIVIMLLFPANVAPISNMIRNL